jgi:hypothetical protein
MHLTRRGWIAIAVTLVLALAGAGAYAYQHYAGLVFVERCTASTPQGKVLLSPDQAANAATIAGVAVGRKLPERAAAIAIATAMQESKLHNLPGGHLDSIGLFQQRPSQGWGKPAQIRDPVYAADRFYDSLVKVPGYRTRALTVVAQEVQRSATPTAYAKHEADANVLAAALTGREAGAMTCAIRTGEYTYQAMGATGLTPRGAAIRRELIRTFGPVRVAGFAPGGVRSGHLAGSAHYEGRAMDVLFRPVNSANQRKGWAVAQWAVSHADDLGITEVIYDGKIWTSRRSAQGWRPYRPPGKTANPITLHRDHVHLTVVRGSASEES